MAGKNHTAEQREDHIRKLDPIAHIRLRPGMYVGGTDVRALHHLIYEVVDNAIDEALAGRCDHIMITLQDDNVVTVADNGGGIPVGIHKTEGISTLEMVMTQVGTGGKFDDQAYKVSGGLHGVGLSAVNALSAWFKAEIYRDSHLWEQTYEAGKPTSDVVKVRKLEPDEGTGTVQTFIPDYTIMDANEFEYDRLEKRFREMAFVTRKVTITLRDERVKPVAKETTFYFEGGLNSFVRYINRNRRELHAPIHAERDVETAPENKKPITVGVELAFQYTDSSTVTELAFANTIGTPDGGSHLTGMRSAITSVINRYARKANLLKEKEANFSGNDTLEGLTAIVSIKHPDPQFESQTKVKLMNPEVQGAVSQVLSEAFAEFLEVNPREARRIVEKCMTSKRAREAAKKARDLVRSGPSLLESSTLPGKLADCSTHGADAEIYIVEGDSAGGCFSGDTQIALADGRNLSFEDLVREQQSGKQHYCYTIRHDGKIGLEKVINARITKRNAKVIRLILDNGEVITCTPDHRFLLRDGSYKQAAELSPHDSLMPLYRQLSDKKEPGITIDGYEMVWDTKTDTWLFTHVLADWYNRWQGVYSVDDGDHCHHKDFNKLNNNPPNIERMPSEEHLELHRQHISSTLHRPDVIDKCRTIRQSEAFRKNMSQRMRQPETREILSKQAQEQWENETYKAYMKEKWLEFYESNPDYQAENNRQLYEAQMDYWSQPENREKQAQRVREYFAQNPEAREQASQKAIIQWEDEDLRQWRSDKTREQWTAEFRTKRKAALDRTYYQKTITALKQIELQHGELDLEAYRNFRIKTGDKTLLRFDTFCDRYFAGNTNHAQKAIENYNHRIVAIERMSERIDVYDVEVPHTHNFALSSGVFVHNSAKQGRDRHFQAILPLRGKILNTERARLDKVLDNNEIKAMISALGTGISEDFNVEKLRYGRVIIMTDADVDGSHIRTLLLTFFFRHMQSLIQDGHLYIAQPPIYRLQHGKNVEYVYPSAGLSEGELLNKALKKFKDPDKIRVGRYKGLGEMNPDQLWDTTMDPATRTLLQVTIDDAAEADRVFDMLMGSSVPPRKRFIQTHAKSVRNLDV